MLRLTRQDKAHVVNVVTALVPHLVDEAALRGRLERWFVPAGRSS